LEGAASAAPVGGAGEIPVQPAAQKRGPPGDATRSDRFHRRFPAARHAIDARRPGFPHAERLATGSRLQARFLLQIEPMSQDLPRWWPIVAGLSALLALLVSIPVPG
jgi:hypothetical protein